jgi:hypothetical protein
VQRDADFLHLFSTFWIIAAYKKVSWMFLAAYEVDTGFGLTLYHRVILGL